MIAEALDALQAALVTAGIPEGNITTDGSNPSHSNVPPCAWVVIARDRQKPDGSIVASIRGATTTERRRRLHERTVTAVVTIRGESQDHAAELLIAAQRAMPRSFDDGEGNAVTVLEAPSNTVPEASQARTQADVIAAWRLVGGVYVSNEYPNFNNIRPTYAGQIEE